MLADVNVVGTNGLAAIVANLHTSPANILKPIDSFAHLCGGEGRGVPGPSSDGRIHQAEDWLCAGSARAALRPARLARSNARPGLRLPGLPFKRAQCLRVDFWAVGCMRLSLRGDPAQ